MGENEGQTVAVGFRGGVFGKASQLESSRVVILRIQCKTPKISRDIRVNGFNLDIVEELYVWEVKGHDAKESRVLEI